MAPPDSTDANLPTVGEGGSPRSKEAVDRFVALWGKMASTWGINRTMAKIHALLYCVERPLNTDQIMERLDVSRGNANMNLRSLVDWNLVAKTQRPDSRKDFYEAEKDVWQITTRIIEERQRREVQPVRKRLQECADLLVDENETIEDRPDPDRVLYHRFENLIRLMEVLEGVSEALLPLVQNKDADQIERLVSFARLLDEQDSNDPDSSH